MRRECRLGLVLGLVSSLDTIYYTILKSLKASGPVVCNYARPKFVSGFFRQILKIQWHSSKAMADVMIENMTDIQPISRYLSAVAVCNSLALLASQGTLTIYLQRMRLLKRIQKTWTKGSSLEIAFTSAADTDSEEELQPVRQKITRDIHRDLGSVKVEVGEAGVLPDGCLLEPVAEDVKDKILENIKEVKEEKKQHNNRGLRSNGSRLKRFRTKSKRKQKPKAKAKRPSANTPHGEKNQLVSETLSMGLAEEGTIDDATGSTTEFDFICAECGLHFRTFALLKNHKQQEHECKVDIKPVKKYVCTSCEKGFDYRSSLVQHKKLHERKLLVCSICSKSFTSKQHLKRHVAQHMSGENQSTRCAKDPKQYICSSCGKRFTSVRSFSEHKKLHLGVKQHVCGVCGEGFMQANVLVTHMRFLHTGERPHVCNVCGKQYIRSTLLKYHMRSHTGEKPYACITCGKAFALPVYLKRHFTTHTGENPYSCSDCSVKFNTRSKLKRHMMTHSNARPFGCSLCTKTFGQMANLRTHMRTHTGEKPYMCKTCGAAFAHQGSLKKHALSHNQEDL